MALDLSKAILHRGKLTESSRAHDYEFWRQQSVRVKMAAIWEMTLFHHMVTEGNETEPRLDRTVGGFRKKQR